MLLLMEQGCEKGNTAGDLNARESVYGNISPLVYLTGRFSPRKQKVFVSLKDMGIPVDNKAHYLRKKAALALRDMYIEFQLDNPRVKFRVRSSTRNFDDQKRIWNNKWNGNTKVGGKRLNRAIKDPVKRAREILRFSSMPGTSRHHWGTDFDINTLTNEYFKSGEGKIVYTWLKKNAHRFGFCQPYTAGRKTGYNEERWHWSYLPLASLFLKDWNQLFNHRQGLSFYTQRDLFGGSEFVGNLAPEYVNGINEACLKR
ncbi:MAG: M15 family metallopeptidase [bacterium]|nr:M15 family metallopeptidase [bacterium]